MRTPAPLTLLVVLSTTGSGLACSEDSPQSSPPSKAASRGDRPRASMTKTEAAADAAVKQKDLLPGVRKLARRLTTAVRCGANSQDALRWICPVGRVLARGTPVGEKDAVLHGLSVYLARRAAPREALQKRVSSAVLALRHHHGVTFAHLVSLSGSNDEERREIGKLRAALIAFLSGGAKRIPHTPSQKLRTFAAGLQQRAEKKLTPWANASLYASPTGRKRTWLWRVPTPLGGQVRDVYVGMEPVRGGIWISLFPDAP